MVLYLLYTTMLEETAFPRFECILKKMGSDSLERIPINTPGPDQIVVCLDDTIFDLYTVIKQWLEANGKMDDNTQFLYLWTRENHITDFKQYIKNMRNIADNRAKHFAILTIIYNLYQDIKKPEALDNTISMNEDNTSIDMLKVLEIADQVISSSSFFPCNLARPLMQTTDITYMSSYFPVDPTITQHHFRNYDGIYKNYQPDSLPQNNFNTDGKISDYGSIVNGGTLYAIVLDKATNVYNVYNPNHVYPSSINMVRDDRLKKKREAEDKIPVSIIVKKLSFVYSGYIPLQKQKSLELLYRDLHFLPGNNIFQHITIHRNGMDFMDYTKFMVEPRDKFGVRIPIAPGIPSKTLTMPELADSSIVFVSNEIRSDMPGLGEFNIRSLMNITAQVILSAAFTLEIRLMIGNNEISLQMANTLATVYLNNAIDIIQRAYSTNKRCFIPFMGLSNGMVTKDSITCTFNNGTIPLVCPLLELQWKISNANVAAVEAEAEAEENVEEHVEENAEAAEAKAKAAANAAANTTTKETDATKKEETQAVTNALLYGEEYAESDSESDTGSESKSGGAGKATGNWRVQRLDEMLPESKKVALIRKLGQYLPNLFTEDEYNEVRDTFTLIGDTPVKDVPENAAVRYQYNKNSPLMYIICPPYVCYKNGPNNTFKMLPMTEKDLRDGKCKLKPHPERKDVIEYPNLDGLSSTEQKTLLDKYIHDIQKKSKSSSASLNYETIVYRKNNVTNGGLYYPKFANKGDKINIPLEQMDAKCIPSCGTLNVKESRDSINRCLGHVAPETTVPEPKKTNVNPTELLLSNYILFEESVPKEQLRLKAVAPLICDLIGKSRVGSSNITSAGDFAMFKPFRPSFIENIQDALNRLRPNDGPMNLREILMEEITITKFVAAFNGTLVPIFMSKENQAYRDALYDNNQQDVFVVSQQKRLADHHDVHVKEFVSDVLVSFTNFKNNLRDDEYITHRFLWEFISAKNDNMFIDGCNLVIITADFETIDPHAIELKAAKKQMRKKPPKDTKAAKPTTTDTNPKKRKTKTKKVTTIVKPIEAIIKPKADPVVKNINILCPVVSARNSKFDKTKPTIILYNYQKYYETLYWIQTSPPAFQPNPKITNFIHNRVISAFKVTDTTGELIPKIRTFINKFETILNKCDIVKQSSTTDKLPQAYFPIPFEHIFKHTKKHIFLIGYDSQIIGIIQTINANKHQVVVPCLPTSSEETKRLLESAGVPSTTKFNGVFVETFMKQKNLATFAETVEFLSAKSNIPKLKGLQPILYAEKNDTLCGVITAANQFCPCKPINISIENLNNIDAQTKDIMTQMFNPDDSDHILPMFAMQLRDFESEATISYSLKETESIHSEVANIHTRYYAFDHYRNQIRHNLTYSFDRNQNIEHDSRTELANETKKNIRSALLNICNNQNHHLMDDDTFENTLEQIVEILDKCSEVNTSAAFKYQLADELLRNDRQRRYVLEPNEVTEQVIRLNTRVDEMILSRIHFERYFILVEKYNILFPHKWTGDGIQTSILIEPDYFANYTHDDDDRMARIEGEMYDYSTDFLGYVEHTAKIPVPIADILQRLTGKTPESMRLPAFEKIKQHMHTRSRQFLNNVFEIDEKGSLLDQLVPIDLLHAWMILSYAQLDQVHNTLIVFTGAKPNDLGINQRILSTTGSLAPDSTVHVIRFDTDRSEWYLLDDTFELGDLNIKSTQTPPITNKVTIRTRDKNRTAVAAMPTPEIPSLPLPTAPPRIVPTVPPPSTPKKRGRKQMINEDLPTQCAFIDNTVPPMFPTPVRPTARKRKPRKPRTPRVVVNEDLPVQCAVMPEESEDSRSSSQASRKPVVTGGALLVPMYDSSIEHYVSMRAALKFKP